MDDLRSASPGEHLRWLTEADEPAFRELLQARYGTSYSYRALYQPGGAARLWRSGTLLSLGRFDEHGQLITHTALWITPGRDCVDSGLSLSRPSQRLPMDRAEHARLWQFLWDKLRSHVGFVHQNTSTLHLMAQRYASRIMKAAPMGLILDYTRGETLIGVEGSGRPMQALAMTTLLCPLAPRARYLPEGPWCDWLGSILVGRGLMGTRVQVPLERRSGRTGFALHPLDWNESLHLERRKLALTGSGQQSGCGLVSTRARVDLIHVPMGDARHVAEGTPLLLEAGFLPTGIRLHQREPDEIVFQHVKDPRAACEALGQARLAGADAQALFSGWSERCVRTS